VGNRSYYGPGLGVKGKLEGGRGVHVVPGRDLIQAGKEREGLRGKGNAIRVGAKRAENIFREQDVRPCWSTK